MSGSCEAPRPVEPLSAERQAAFVLGSLARWLALAQLECRGMPADADRGTWVRSRPRHEERGAPVVGETVPAPRVERTPYYPLNMVHAAEPRIEVLARSLSALLTMVELTGRGEEVIEPDGFHLRRLRAWRTAIRPHDTEPIEHYLATGLCNVNCEFCYEHGTPPEMRTPKFRVGRTELETRLRYYDAGRGLALFDMFHQYYDAFAHPDAIPTLERLRPLSRGVLDLITNGRRLTPDIVERLDALRPLQLTISLNSQDPAVRARVMRDRTPEVAARSLPLLHEARIPFGIVVVPWPPEIDPPELERTIRFVDRFDPMFVSVSLPGYTRWFPRPPRELTDEYHRAVVATVRRLRAEVETPLLVQPRMAEAVLYEEDHTRPFVLGTMPDSPARASRLRHGDTLEAVNGFATPFASQASQLVRLSQEGGARELRLRLRRGGERWEATLHRDDGADRAVGWGLVLPDGLEPRLFRELAAEIRQSGDRDVWLLSSRWMSDFAQRMLVRTDPEVAERVQVVPVDNAYFGGNIALGDLLTVTDFASAIDQRLERRPAPDRVVVPGSAFTRWGRDLRGRSVQRLRRRFDVPITIVDNARIMV